MAKKKMFKTIREFGETFLEISVKGLNDAILPMSFQIDEDNTEIDINDNIEEEKEVFFDYFGTNFDEDFKSLQNLICDKAEAMRLQDLCDWDSLSDIDEDDADAIAVKVLMSFENLKDDKEVHINWME